MTSPLDVIDDTLRRRLAAGEHEAVAHELEQRGDLERAGIVYEQIWAFDAALRCYLQANVGLPALRVALDASAPDAIDRALAAVQRGALADPTLVERAIALLEHRRRPLAIASLLEHRPDAAAKRAQALIHAGDRIGAAGVLANAGQAHAALEVLRDPATTWNPAHAAALAAQLHWSLGDAEGAARHAQRAMAAGHDDESVRTVLARALMALGHDLAAQLVLPSWSSDDALELAGRYRVLQAVTPTYTGAAVLAVDRITLEEVEIHLLLADQPELGSVDPVVRSALDRFAAAAMAASKLGHPAIRPILRLDPAAGILVMPRAAGPDLRTLIRQPGMPITRARAVIAFLLEGLSQAHAAGLVHGSLLPSQLVCDAASRPLLGPFGAHHLSGMLATRTGAMEELMLTTAPELRSGAPPSVASDIFALGMLFAALVRGDLGGGFDDTPQMQLARAMAAEDPTQRPDIATLHRTLAGPVLDVQELANTPSPRESAADSGSDFTVPSDAVDVVAAESWSDDLLESLCTARNPWLQPIVDRNGRQFALAPWPSGCRGLDAQSAPTSWRDWVPQEAWSAMPLELRRAIEERLAPTSIVTTPAGDWMLALDDLLSR